MNAASATAWPSRQTRRSPPVPVEAGGQRRRDFDADSAGRTVAHAFDIKDVGEYKHPANLNALGHRLPDVIVPQSWRYVRPEAYRLFRTMNRLRKKPEQAEGLNAVGSFVATHSPLAGPILVYPHSRTSTRLQYVRRRVATVYSARRRQPDGQSRRPESQHHRTGSGE